MRAMEQNEKKNHQIKDYGQDSGTCYRSELYKMTVLKFEDFNRLFHDSYS